MTNQNLSLKQIREHYKTQGIFYTPPELAKLIKTHLPKNPATIYDPTCGGGNLLSIYPNETQKYGQDISPDAIAHATNTIPNFHGHTGDTLTNPGFTNKRFDAIIANPPFSIKWNPNPNDPRFTVAPTLPPPSRADYAFILHMLHMLTPTGTAATLGAPGILYRGQREAKIREWLINNHHIQTIVAIPPNQFDDTTIPTVLVVLRKQRKESTITFHNLNHNTTHTATLQEIRDNDYNLSPNLYVPDPLPPRPQFDPIQTELDARKQAIEQLNAQLQFTLAVCNLDPQLPPPNDFFTDIRRTVNKAAKQWNNPHQRPTIEQAFELQKLF